MMMVVVVVEAHVEAVTITVFMEQALPGGGASFLRGSFLKWFDRMGRPICQTPR